MSLSSVYRRSVLCILILSMLLASCGSPAATTSQPTPAQHESNPAATTAQPTDSTQTTGSSTQNTASGEREVSHAMGTAKVPAHPERVVVLDNGALDNALALGVMPIGAATVLDDGVFPSYLKDKAQNIASVGTIDQPNIERILVLKPDLILGNKGSHEAIYDKLSAIAPTVLVETLGVTWKANFEKQAEALGKEAEAKQLMDEYQSRIVLFQQRMGDQIRATKVSVIRSRPDKLSLYLKQSFIGTILQDVGLPRPPAQDKDAFAEDVTLELLNNADADVIFWTHRDPSKSQLVEIMKNPLWSQLTAVKEGRVYEVSHEIWISGLGITAVQHILDDLFNHLIATP